MAEKKGQIPEHVIRTQKQHCHPKSSHPIISLIAEMKDSRSPSLFLRYSLCSVLFMALTAVICGATDWAKVVVMSEGMCDWLALYVDMSSGVPCERTFTNIFNTIDPTALENILQNLQSLFAKDFRMK